MTYGPGTLLSHGPAGVHQDICEESRAFPIHVVTPRPNPRSRDEIVVHRCGPVDPRDVRRFAGVPCVSADLVLVQLAPSLSENELEVILVAAESKRFLKRNRLAELVAERRGRPGIPKLASLLELEPVIAKSDLELIFLPLWRAAGVERPLVNHPIAVPGRKKPLIVDFAWPEIRMVVEADSQRFHGDWERAADDRERDQLVSLANWRPHRFARTQVVSGLAASARRLRDLTEARVAELDRGRC